MSIEIRKIVQRKCDLYDNNNVFIGTIDSDLSLLDVRVQIKKQNIDGYYLIWDDNKNLIRPNGDLEGVYPYDESLDLLMELV